MARKTLLTEAEIRQFMKLANIKPLQEMGGELPVGKRDDDELDEMRKKKKSLHEEEDEDLDEAIRDSKPPATDDDRDEKMEEAYGSMMPGKDDEKDEDLAEQDDEMEMDMGAPEGGAEMEMDAEMDMAPMPEPEGMGDEMGGMEGKEAQFADIVDKLADLLGLDADVEVGGDEGMGGDAMDDKGGDLDVPMDAPEAPEMEMGDEDEADEPMMESDEDIVQEVARRVAARLLREKKQEDVANKLAERIFRRLASK
jgi:hypothetical protein